MPRHGTWTETGSGPDVRLIAAVAVVVVLCGGGSAGAFAAHLSAAITDLLYWVAGVMGAAMPGPPLTAPRCCVPARPRSRTAGPAAPSPPRTRRRRRGHP